MNADENYQMLLERVIGAIKASLEEDNIAYQAEDITDNTDPKFPHLGLEPIHLIAIKNTIGEATGFDLSKKVYLNFNSVGDIARHLQKRPEYKVHLNGF